MPLCCYLYSFEACICTHSISYNQLDQLYCIYSTKSNSFVVCLFLHCHSYQFSVYGPITGTLLQHSPQIASKIKPFIHSMAQSHKTYIVYIVNTMYNMIALILMAEMCLKPLSSICIYSLPTQKLCSYLSVVIGGIGTRRIDYV